MKTKKELVLIWLAVLLGASSCLWAKESPSVEKEDIFEMSLEELMNIEITSSASLTSTTRKMTPATMTTITQEDIQSSGARSLNELLDIYVPNLQMILHHWEAKHLGLRGIINDREEKYLLLVNGKVMNERTHYGVLSERDMPMLTDIHHIDVVRGPGSAIYGPGAVSMVINIITDNAMTFQGTEITTRVGAVEEFYSTEIKYGKKFDDDRGLFGYFGIDRYLGADQGDAPVVYGTSFTDFWGAESRGGKPYDAHNINRDGQAYRDLPRIKSHVQYTDGPFEIWARYTRGGEQFTFAQDNLASPPYGWLDPTPGGWTDLAYPSYESFRQPESGYQQFTLYTDYKQQVTEDFKLTYSFSYDMFDFERTSFDSEQSPSWNYNHREDEYFTKILANWDINDKHQLAYGFEWSHEQFGLNSPGFPGTDAILSPWQQPPHDGVSPEWSTDTFSVFGEHQWRLNDQWTTFLGGRIDKNECTDYLFSPRFTALYAPNKQDVWKLIWAKSMRMTFAEEMRWNWEYSHDKSDPENITNYEIRYEHQHTPNLLMAAGAFYQEIDVIAWDGGTWGIPFDAGTRDVGKYDQYGLEAELLYKTDTLRLTLSHGFVQLLSFDLAPGSNTSITSEPYGYGDSLANWSSHVSKIVGRYDFDKKWSAYGSARIYWDFEGAKDSAKRATDSSSPYSRDPGYNDPYGASVFLSLGLEYRPSKNLTFRLDGYNLMGLFDEKYNKRLYGFNSYGDYRSSAPALGISLKYRF